MPTLPRTTTDRYDKDIPLKQDKVKNMKHHIGIGTFYITNVCNLTCNRCASFNNLRFKNHFEWSNSEQRAKKWKEILEIDEISILGGEPFCHPRLDEWVLGIRSIWPQHSNIRICTNGTYLSTNIERVRKYLDLGIIIEVSVHDPKQWDSIESIIETILFHTPYDKIRRIGKYDIPNGKEYSEVIVDYSNKNSYPLFKLVEAYEFFPTAINSIEKGLISLHRSDMEVAHKNCDIKDCHYFVDGILYKCVTQAIGVFLKEQFPLDSVSQSVIGSTKGIDPFDNPLEKLKNINSPIKECQLCPEHPLADMIKIYPLTKSKIRL
jgi:uncharacterized Fe-S cluster-containing radical SAM superfamily protein